MAFIEELRARDRDRLTGSINHRTDASQQMPWRNRLQTLANQSKLDPWERALGNIHGKVGKDGVERVSTAECFEVLEVAETQRARGAARLATLMEKLGWQRMRMYRLNRGGYADRVRGYARMMCQ